MATAARKPRLTLGSGTVVLRHANVTLFGSLAVLGLKPVNRLAAFGARRLHACLKLLVALPGLLLERERCRKRGCRNLGQSLRIGGKPAPQFRLHRTLQAITPAKPLERWRVERSRERPSQGGHRVKRVALGRKGKRLEQLFTLPDAATQDRAVGAVLDALALKGIVAKAAGVAVTVVEFVVAKPLPSTADKVAGVGRTACPEEASATVPQIVAESAHIAITATCRKSTLSMKGVIPELTHIPRPVGVGPGSLAVKAIVSELTHVSLPVG